MEEDKRNLIQKFTDSRKFMIATVIDLVGLAVNQFLDVGIPAIHLWYGCLGMYALCMILIAVEDVAKTRAGIFTDKK